MVPEYKVHIFLPVFVCVCVCVCVSLTVMFSKDGYGEMERIVKNPSLTVSVDLLVFIFFNVTSLFVPDFCKNTLKIRGAQIFQKSRSRLELLGARIIA